MGFANAGFIHDSWDHNLKSTDCDPVAFWKRITGLDRYNVCSNKASGIHNLVLRYIQRVMACTIWGRKEVGPTRTDELFMLWAMLNNRPVNTCYYLLDYLSFVAKKKPDDKSEILVGGIITFIARRFGVGEERGINGIEENNIIDIETLVRMFFVRPYGPAHALTYELRTNRDQSLIILPNPARTDTRVAENVLYVVANPHVQEDHGDDEEVEGGHLQDDSVQHDQEAGGQYDNDRWEWMHTEIQRMSTEQQRQGVEISRLCGDVQRGNRMHEQNNCMLLRMMQHFNLQDPPQ